MKKHQDIAAIPCLFVELAACVQRGLSLVETGDVVGFVYQRVQPVAKTRRRPIEAKAVLPHEHAFLKRIGIKPKYPVTDLLAVELDWLSRLDFDDLQGVACTGCAELAKNAVLAAIELEVESAAVFSPAPGLVTQTLVLAHVANAFAFESVQHGFYVCGQRSLAPTIRLQNHVQTVVEG